MLGLRRQARRASTRTPARSIAASTGMSGRSSSSIHRSSCSADEHRRQPVRQLQRQVGTFAGVVRAPPRAAHRRARRPSRHGRRRLLRSAPCTRDARARRSRADGPSVWRPADSWRASCRANPASATPWRARTMVSNFRSCPTFSMAGSSRSGLSAPSTSSAPPQSTVSPAAAARRGVRSQRSTGVPMTERRRSRRFAARWRTPGRRYRRASRVACRAARAAASGPPRATPRPARRARAPSRAR